MDSWRFRGDEKSTELSHVIERDAAARARWFVYEVERGRVMCRWFVYVGPAEDPVDLHLLITAPEHGILAQAKRKVAFCPGVEGTAIAKASRNHAINADGFGLGWYSQYSNIFPEGSLFRSTETAWSSANLAELCRVMSASLCFAHIRSASPGMVVASINCHPFRHERFMFMQNGGIARFCAVKRRLCTCLSDHSFHAIHGTTDSEHVFAIVMEVLAQTKGASMPPSGSGASRLRADSCDSVARASQDGLRLAAALRAAIVLVSALQRSVGISCEESSSSLNFALTDGELVVASRCRTFTEDAPPSLYYHCAPSIAVAVARRSTPSGSAGRCSRTPQQCRLSPHLAAMPEPGGEKECGGGAAVPRRGRQVIIASEPIDFEVSYVMHCYISCESCSQFDSLPYTTISTCSDLEDTASRQARRVDCGPRQQKWQLIKKNSVLIATSDYGVRVAPLSLPAWEDLPPLSDGGGAWSGLGDDCLSTLYYESYVLLEMAVEAAEIVEDDCAAATGSCRLDEALGAAFAKASGGCASGDTAASPLPDALPFLDLGSAAPAR